MRNKLFLRLPLAAAVIGAVSAIPAHAIDLNFGDDSEFSGSINTTLSYGNEFRTRDAQQPLLNGGGNAASEGRAAHAGDVASNVFGIKTEINLDWRNYGFVGSAAYQYDTEIMHGKSYDPYTGESNDWSDAAKKHQGNSLDLLDAYIYGTFDLGENPLELRLGQQAINWGEGLVFLDGISVQSPLNYAKLVTPGAEFKEAMVGNQSIFAQMGVGEASSIEAYVHFDWNRSEFSTAGTFYGSDSFFRGGDEAWIDSNAGFAQREPDQKAKDSGQWGIAGRTAIGDTEYGLYYSRYHETTPGVKLAGEAVDWEGFSNLDTATSATGIAQIWEEDTEMFGTSFSTTVGTWSFAGEIAYRPNRPLFGNISDGSGFNEELSNTQHRDTVTASVNGIWLGGPTILGIDSQYALYQVGADYIDGDRTQLATHNTITRNESLSLSPDALAYGVAFNWGGTWNNVTPGTNLTLDLYIQEDLKGNSHFWGNFAEGRTMIVPSLIADIGTSWQATMTYVYYEQKNSDYSDQDTIAISVNYKF